MCCTRYVKIYIVVCILFDKNNEDGMLVYKLAKNAKRKTTREWRKKMPIILGIRDSELRNFAFIYGSRLSLGTFIQKVVRCS